jgi:predicted metal-dependent hydrolase
VTLSESEIEDEVDDAPPLSPTPEEKEAIVKDKNVIGHINGEMAEILLDFVTTADETLNDDYTLFPEKKVATLWGISSMKELDARYAKRVRTATAELIVYAKSMIKFIREYSDAMAKIDEMAFFARKK